MHITLHLTNNCNMDCSYCYASKGSLYMSYETAKKAVANFANMDNCGIIFFGGEPLLQEELIRRVVEDSEKEYPNQFHYKITTNGTLLTEDFINFATTNNIHIAISHDGVKEAHDRFRKDSLGEGTFDILLPKLKLVLKYMPYSPIMLTVNPETVNYFYDSVTFLQALGAKYLICSINFAGNWDKTAFKNLKKQYRNLADWHYRNYKDGNKLYFSPFDKRISSHIHSERVVSCELGKRQISIAPDGTLYPCVQFVGHQEYAIGSVNTGIERMKQHKLYSLNEQDKKPCSGCAIERRCHNKCACLNFQTTGDITTIPDILCEYERMVLPIADSLASKLYKERNPLFIQRHYNPLFPIFSFLEDLTV